MNVKPKDALKHEREQRGWSQEKVAEAIGTSAHTVSRWERHISLPYPYYREKLCALFAKTALELGLMPHSCDEEPAESRTSSVAHIFPPSSFASEQHLFDPLLPRTSLQGKALVGRADLLEQLKQRLCQRESVALTALKGLPGVGKTALATALALDEQVQACFPDGMLWAGLGPHPQATAVLARWATLLGIAPPSDQRQERSVGEWGQMLRMVIGNRRLLLVLDDVWQEEVAWALRVGGRYCAHLLTTRLPQVAHGWADKHVITVPELEEPDAVALMARSVPELVAQEPEIARELVQAVGGLPLALTLLSRYLGAAQVTRQSRRLRSAVQQLQEAKQRIQLGAPSEALGYVQHAETTTLSVSLQTAIALSEQQIEEQARTGLHTLSLFTAKPNSFSEEAAVVIMGGEVEVLDQLCDAGLVESIGEGRYNLHQTIADYARQGTHQEVAEQRLIAYYVEWLSQHEKDYEAIEQESENLQLALKIAWEHEKKEEYVQGVLALTDYWLLRGMYASAERQLLQAYQIAQEVEATPELIRIIERLGMTYEKRGDYEQAELLFHQGIELARQRGHQELMSRLLNSLGTIAYQRGKYEQAKAFLLEGMTVARQIGNRELMSRLLCTSSAMALDLGNYQQGEALVKEGLEFARQINHYELMSRLLGNMGLGASRQGKYEQAEVYYLQGLELAQQMGYHEQISRILTNLGGDAFYQGKYEQAEVYYLQGLELAQQMGYRELISMALNNLAEVLAHQGKDEQAERYYLEALDLSQQIGKAWLVAALLVEWGGFLLSRHRLENATATFQKALASVPEENRVWQAKAYYGLAQIAVVQGQLIEAHQQAEISLALFDQIGHHQAAEVRNWLMTLPV